LINLTLQSLIVYFYTTDIKHGMKENNWLRLMICQCRICWRRY